MSPFLTRAWHVYADKRMGFIFLNGIASGFPWVIIGSAMTLWLKDAGLTRTAIGFFGSIFAVYSLNWLWAPFIDRLKIPYLHQLGQRRHWLMLCQFVMMVLLLFLSQTNPAKSLFLTSLLALGIAFVSASQDVVIDAWRIDILGVDERDKLPVSAAMATAGWWTGYSIPGAFALYLSGFFTWPQVYLWLALFMIVILSVTWFLPEPKHVRDESHRKSDEQWQNLLGGKTTSTLKRVLAWFLSIFATPIIDMFKRYGRLTLALFAFIFLFKIGEAFLGRMSLIFYKEVGFTTAEIATYSKLVGWVVTVFFSLLASLLTLQMGLFRGLFISGIAMAATNLLFALIAWTGPNPQLFVIAIILDNFTSAFSTVAFVGFVSYLTNHLYSATQYALLASVGNFGRTVFAGGSGLLVDSLEGNWTLFFIITTVMVLPSLIILSFVYKRLMRA